MKPIVSLASLALAVLASLVLLGVFPNPQTARSAGCSNSTLRGTYGWIGNGAAGAKPDASVGIETFDGAGNSSSDFTYSYDGKVSHDKFTGSYTIRADCTGTMNITYADGSKGNLDLVVVDGGREVYWIITDSGLTINGSKKKIQ